MVSSAPSRRCTSSPVVMYPRSCAASVASRPIPMLVGDVRRARRAPDDLLEVVGRQPVVLRRRRRPRSTATSGAPAGGRGAARRASTDASRSTTGRLSQYATSGRHEPRRQDRQGRHPDVGRRQPDRRDQRERDDRARDHADDEGVEARAAVPRVGTGGDAGRRLPLEQAPLRDDQAHEREDDGVHHLPGVVREQHQRQRGLRERGLQVVAEPAREDDERPAAATAP